MKKMNERGVCVSSSSDLDFERKHAEDLERLRGFRLLDDDFMNKVFEDKACAEFLLQIILRRNRFTCTACTRTARY